MNRYPLWKYIVIGVALLVSMIYAAPNLFGEVPAVQVSGLRSTVKVDDGLRLTLDEALKAAKVTPAATEMVEGTLRYRFADPREAARGAHLVTTDVWTSMGFEAESEARNRAFAGFRVDAAMMACADRDGLFMHCLPAHRGEEVSSEVVDGPQSVVWEEAENRLHVQKALMEYLLLGKIET